jgi:PEGA domain
MNGAHGMRRVCRAAGSAIAITLACPFAAAQSAPTAAGPSEASGHFERGVTFYNEADYVAAVVEFKRAYALAPAWQVLFNVGQSDFQIHDYAGALVTLRQFLDEGQDRVPDDRRALVASELTDLANRVGHARITSNVAGAEVTMDDAAVGVTPLSQPVLVSVGVRKVTATYAGRAPIEREVPVAAAETVDVQLDFPEVPAALTPPMRAPSAAVTLVPVQAAPSRKRGPAIAAFGLGVAGAGVGTMFGILAMGDKSRLDAECAGKACRVGSQSDIDAMSRDSTVSTVGFGVMAVGVVVGVALWVTSGRSATRTQDAATEIHPGFVSATF